MGFFFSGEKVMYALLLIFIFLDIFGSNAQLLSEDEVQALRTIFRKLNQTVNIERTSCSDGNWNFKAGSSPNTVTSNITCDCSLNASSICRVTNIKLQGHGEYNPFFMVGSSSFFVRDMLEISNMCILRGCVSCRPSNMDQQKASRLWSRRIF